MRNFQTKVNVGGPQATPIDTKYSAEEFNALVTEQKNTVTRSGQTLFPENGSGDTFIQQGRAMMINGLSAQAFQDNGTVNTYQVTPLTGISGLVVPDSFAQLIGATIVFKPLNAPTGASTLNIGQSTSSYLGAKPFINKNGSTFSGSEFSSGDYVIAKYDPSIGSGVWTLLYNMNFIGFPATLTSLTTNNVTQTEHTHVIDTGITDTKIVRIDDAAVASTEYARFTTNGLQGRTTSEVLADLGLSGQLVGVSFFVSIVSGNYVKPANLAYAEVYATGGGGSGSAGGTTPGAGGAAATAIKIYSASALAASEPFVVGAGGASVAPTSSGLAGGNSTFKTLVGTGGSGGSVAGAGGSRVNAAGSPDLNCSGSGGDSSTGSGSTSFWGGGGYGRLPSGVNGESGGPYGGGGSGSSSGNSGAGGTGVIVIKQYLKA